MGILKKLFNGQDESHEEDWALYLSTINEDRVGSVLVDLGLAEFAPVQGREIIVRFELDMREPNENGLTSQDESDTLNGIEDRIIAALTKDKRSVYAGRLNAESKIRSYFYSTDANDLDESVARVMAEFPEYVYDLSDELDREWNTYFELLYPLPIQMQSIQNGRVIENVQKHGDNLTAERPVDHWIYFKTGDDRADFINRIRHMNFTVVTETDAGSEEYAYLLQISRSDKVDRQSVDDYVLALWEEAQACNGSYDGWETFIVKD